VLFGEIFTCMFVFHLLSVEVSSVRNLFMNLSLICHEHITLFFFFFSSCSKSTVRLIAFRGEEEGDLLISLELVCSLYVRCISAMGDLILKSLDLFTEFIMLSAVP
jgi:hypothetical protein